MIDKIDHIFLLRTGVEDAPIFGALPSADYRAGLKDMLHGRPAARKEGNALIVAIPLLQPLSRAADGQASQTASWAIWQLGAIPPVLELPRVLSNLTDLSRGFLAQAGASQPSPIGGLPHSGIADAEAALADLPARRRKNLAVLAARIGDYLSEKAMCGTVVFMAVRAGSVRKALPSDDRLKPVLGQLRAIYQAQLAAERGTCRIASDSDLPEDFEASVVLASLNAQSMSLFFPTSGTGYGAVVLDAPPIDIASHVHDATAVLQMSRPMSNAPLLGAVRKRLLMAAGAAVALWLVWPAPTWLTVTGTSVPDATLTVALPSDATLQQMFVRVGQRVEKDAPLAQLFSAQLEERRSQEALSIKVEELAAQAAMSENNFGAFQLAQQRGEIAKTRLAQIEARIAQLLVVSPAAGLIVAAVPDTAKGAAMTTGTALAEVQTAPKFLVRLNPARLDARLMDVGQTGHIYFRGLSDRTYEMQLITPPVAMIEQATKTEKLEAYAQIITADDGRLMGGLSGYARIAAPRQMRFMALTRHLREYIRVQAWTHLGLPL